MIHEASLIATFAMGLMFAFGGGWAASRLGLPPLVGYLLAGIAVGPFTPGYVADSGLAQELAEIGVILLMFGVGLHFSIKDLWAVRGIAVPGAVAQIAVATTIGVLLSALWGWSLAGGIVFGLALSVASTVVLLRALEERKSIQSINGRIAVGWLIVEDLAMVVALVLLPVLGSLNLNGEELNLALLTGILPDLGMTLAKVAVFITIMLIAGRRVVPWLLKQIVKQGSRELFTLAVLALAMGIAYLSSALFGVSFALGAFFAGVVMSESELSYKAAAESLPLKDAFAVLFFVSVGMLFDPAILVKAPLEVLAVLLVIIVGKSLAAFVIVLLFRYPVSTALTVSASLAQIGEFSFILAAMGLSLGLLPVEAQAYILAGALLSIALNPLVFRGAAYLERWIHSRPHLQRGFERMRQDRLVELPLGIDRNELSGHAVIVGYGRVGQIMAHAFDQQGVRYLIVEQNRQGVKWARKQGRAAIWGDASVAGVLEKAGIDNAKLLVLAIPDGFQIRLIVEIARRLNPVIEMLARTHSDREREYLEKHGVNTVVMAERELAFSMLKYALKGFGFDDDTAKGTIKELRKDGVVLEHEEEIEKREWT